MPKTLQQYFPIIRNRSDILAIIHSDAKLLNIYHSWSIEQQHLFLDFCSGARGVKILYDAFFKEIFNPENDPTRLERLLSLIMGQQVKVLKTLPTEGSRLGADSPLLIMDILVELEDKSLANIECQRYGYKFPGQRAACYSADLLMRQYRRIKSEKGKSFSYKDIQKVCCVIFYVNSPSEFKSYSPTYIHHIKQQTDSELDLNLLQEFYFVNLDIFQDVMQYKAIETPLEAWLTFLSSDEPTVIMALLTDYPEFQAMYNDIYTICRNIEKVMYMFSEELLILDKNTAQYMIDEMQGTINHLTSTVADQKNTISDQKSTISDQESTISDQKSTISDQKNTISSLENTVIDLNDKIQLFHWLSKQNRVEDLARAAQDNEFCILLLNEWKQS